MNDNMKIVGLVGAMVGWSAPTVMKEVKRLLEEKYSGEQVEVIDLADDDVEFSDGRNFLDYSGDTGKVVQLLMEADVIVIATPVFQASIPGTLKNVFDLLPQDAFVDKTVGMVVMAGTDKHYLVAEQQLKPILSFMKANIVQNYVFALQQDIVQGKIISQDVLYRLDRLVDEVMLSARAYREMKAWEDDQYDF